MAMYETRAHPIADLGEANLAVQISAPSSYSSTRTVMTLLILSVTSQQGAQILRNIRIPLPHVI